MKRGLFLIGFFLCLLMVSFPASSFETKWEGAVENIATHSIQTESASIATGRGFFYGIIVRTDGTNNVTLNVYDSGAASGNRLLPSNIVINGVNNVSGWAFGTDPALKFTAGIYVDASVAGGGTVEYEVLYYKIRD